EQQAVAGQADPHRFLALAELADQIARPALGQSPDEALLWSRDAAVYAVFCLAELGENQARCALACKAQSLHNAALSRCLTLARTHAKPACTGWRARLAGAGIVLLTTVPDWSALGMDSLQLTSEYAVISPGLYGRRLGL